MQVTSTI